MWLFLWNVFISRSPTRINCVRNWQIESTVKILRGRSLMISRMEYWHAISSGGKVIQETAISALLLLTFSVYMCLFAGGTVRSSSSVI